MGQQIPIVITIEAAYSQTRAEPALLLEALTLFIGGFNTIVSFTNALFPAAFAGENEIGFIQTIMVNSGSLFYINMAFPQTSAGFGLTPPSPQPGALPTNAIPVTLDPSNFGIVTFSVVEASVPADLAFLAR